MKNWNKKDTGKIIIFKTLSGKESEEAALVRFYKEVPGIIKVIEYPLSLDSKIFHLGLSKLQEKNKLEDLNEPGDWYCKGKVSKQEYKELERIAKPNIPLI